MVAGSTNRGRAESAGISWRSVVLAAVLMLATLPGRTQGLGLITEPMLADLRLDRTTYAGINLWATLLGAAFCLPAGWMLDRFGLRIVTTFIVLLLGTVVWAMSTHTGDVVVLFGWVLLTRALGQSALSVASITAAGKGSGGHHQGMAMGVYSVLLSVFFAAAFLVVGGVVTSSDWRVAWRQVAAALLFVVAPLAAIFLNNGTKNPTDTYGAASSGHGLSLKQALSTPVFWIFGGGIALFGLVSAGIGLFNEAVLAERGFDRNTYHSFLAVMAIVALAGQFACGWLSRRWTLSRLLGIALWLYAASLAAVPIVSTMPQLWAFAAAFGFSGGMITVVFFAVWGHAFGPAHLGRIQGAAQTLAVIASALGPLVFALSWQHTGSYAPLLFLLAPIVLLFGIAAWRTKIAPPAAGG